MDAPALSPTTSVLPRRNALRFIVLLGIVSLFADMTYEGARSITGPYLALLGASATVVGFVAGFGELMGYALRLVSGYVSDRTGRYWPITIFGFVLNLFAVPALALTGRWELAAVLIVAERMGKAIRSPARDAMLSHASSQTGLGWGFGLHEAMDQAGAIIGPVILSAVLVCDYDYREAFGILIVPPSFRFRSCWRPVICFLGRGTSIWRRRRSGPAVCSPCSGSTWWRSRSSPPATPTMR
jgi:MFS family permease